MLNKLKILIFNKRYYIKLQYNKTLTMNNSHIIHEYKFQ